MSKHLNLQEFSQEIQSVMLTFFNLAQEGDIEKGLCDDPRITTYTVTQSREYAIGPTVAKRIVDLREKLGGKFESLEFVNSIEGLGIDKLHDLAYSAQISLGMLAGESNGIATEPIWERVRQIEDIPEEFFEIGNLYFQEPLPQSTNWLPAQAVIKWTAPLKRDSLHVFLDDSEVKPDSIDYVQREAKVTVYWLEQHTLKAVGELTTKASLTPSHPKFYPRSASVTFTVKGFNVQPAIQSLEVQQGKQGCLPVSAFRGGGFSGNIRVEAADLPAGVTCTGVTLADQPGELVFAIAAKAPAGCYHVTIKAVPESGESVYQDFSFALNIFKAEIPPIGGENNWLDGLPVYQTTYHPAGLSSKYIFTEAASQKPNLPNVAFECGQPYFVKVTIHYPSVGVAFSSWGLEDYYKFLLSIHLPEGTALTKPEILYYCFLPDGTTNGVLSTQLPITTQPGSQDILLPHPTTKTGPLEVEAWKLPRGQALVVAMELVSNQPVTFNEISFSVHSLVGTYLWFGLPHNPPIPWDDNWILQLIQGNIGFCNRCNRIVRVIHPTSSITCGICNSSSVFTPIVPLSVTASVPVFVN